MGRRTLVSPLRAAGIALMAAGVFTVIVLSGVTGAQSETGTPAAPRLIPSTTAAQAPPVVAVPAAAAGRARDIAAADAAVRQILASSPAGVVQTVPASSGTVPDRQLVAVVYAFRTRGALPAGLPMLVTRGEGAAPLPLSRAVAMSTTAVPDLDSFTALIDLTAGRLFAVQPGGLAPR